MWQLIRGVFVIACSILAVCLIAGLFGLETGSHIQFKVYALNLFFVLTLTGGIYMLLSPQRPNPTLDQSKNIQGWFDVTPQSSTSSRQLLATLVTLTWCVGSAATLWRYLTVSNMTYTPEFFMAAVFCVMLAGIFARIWLISTSVVQQMEDPVVTIDHVAPNPGQTVRVKVQFKALKDMSITKMSIGLQCMEGLPSSRGGTDYFTVSKHYDDVDQKIEIPAGTSFVADRLIVIPTDAHSTFSPYQKESIEDWTWAIMLKAELGDGSDFTMKFPINVEPALNFPSNLHRADASDPPKIQGPNDSEQSHP